jgi:hypothetical protein
MPASMRHSMLAENSAADMRDQLPGALLQPTSSCHARDKYVPSAVSTRIVSPSLMNGGT